MIQNTVTISFGNLSLSAVSYSVRIHLKQERIGLNLNWVGFQIPKGGEPVLGPCTLALCQHFDTMEKMIQEQAFSVLILWYTNRSVKDYGGEKGPDTALQRARHGN